MGQFQPLDQLPRLYKEKMATLSGTYNPNKGAIPLGNTNNGFIGNSMNIKQSSNPLGFNAKSPITPPQNNTISPKDTKLNKPTGGINTTEGGTQSNARLNQPTPTVASTVPPTSTTGGQTYQPTDTGLYGKLVADLANRSTQSGTDYQTAQAEANRIAAERAKLAQDFAQKDANINRTAGFLTQATGLEGILQNQYNQANAALSAQEQSATNRLGAANTQQGLLQTALQNAVGYAQPTLGTAGQVPYSPVTGTQGSVLGTGGQGGLDINSLAKQVLSGQMSIDQANSALGGNIALTGALRNTIIQSNPNFNFSQSSTLAGQQGTIKPAYEFAKTALTNVQDLMTKLGLLQGTNVPAVNYLGNTFSGLTGIGSEQTRAVAGAVQEARNAYAQLLAASKGGTPSEYTAQATTAIPDNPTPNDIKAAMSNLETLGQAKIGIYGNPGQSNTSTTAKSNTWNDIFGQ